MTIAALVFCTAASLSAHKTVVSPFTYYRDIRPLFERSCASCHDQQAAAPLLLRYDDAVLSSTAIEGALLSQSRPEHGAQLTHVEFDQLMTWSAGGTPEGDRPAGAPVPTPRPHAPHQAQLGGILVPIAGDTLHAEVMFAEQRRVRVAVSNTGGDPASAERVRRLRLSVKVGEVAVPLAVLTTGDLLEARIPSVRLPTTFTLIDRDDSATPPSLRFSAYSVTPPDFTIPPTEIPTTDPEFFAEIKRQAELAMRHVAESQYGQLYVPTTHIRDLLIAMETGGANRDRALRAMMRANWALHLAGDNGLPREIRQAADALPPAVRALVASSGK